MGNWWLLTGMPGAPRGHLIALRDISGPHTGKAAAGTLWVELSQ